MLVVLELFALMDTIGRNIFKHITVCLCLLKFVGVKLQVRLSTVGIKLRDTELKSVFCFIASYIFQCS